jgi:glycosyltransferase involved in cell wall biosynthesis
MKKHAVSVIIPTYNRGQLLVRALRSVLAAIEQGDEVIVVDDASTDDTNDRLSPFMDRICYLRLPHGGAGRARNAGLAQARNPLISFLDSDDEWMPDKLDLQRKVMQQWPELIFCYSDFASLLQCGEVHPLCLRRWLHEKRPWDEVFGPGCRFSSFAELPAGRDDFCVHVSSIYRAMLQVCHVWTCTIMVRRELAGAALHFPEDQPCYEDWECFSRLSGLGTGAFLSCATAWQHDHGGERLTDLQAYKRTSCILRMLNRVWGQDEQFLEHYRGEYERAVTRQRLILARHALVEGRPGEARAELVGCTGSPQVYLHRLLTRLPSPLTQGLRGARNLVMPKSVAVPRPGGPGGGEA